MNGKKLYKEIGSIDADLIENADLSKEKKVSAKLWLKLSAAAACVALAVCASAVIYTQSTSIPLTNSSGNVSARYIKKAPDASKTSEDLVQRTEAELFSEFNTVIFSGTVTEINNIKIDFNGSAIYQAVAKISVDSVLRGECAVGETVEVLLPCTIGDGVWVEDTGVIRTLRVGTKGIFMPTEYNDENSTFIYNGTNLDLRDIAAYGFADGERYAFLETDNGILFSRFAYKSIEDASSLTEIEEYITGMIGE